MTKYVLKRILLLIPVLLGVLIVVFTITYLTPGDPVVTILGTGYTPEKYAAKAAELGLDKGYLEQLWNYIWHIFARLDFGKSYITNVPVATELATRVVVTSKIAIITIIIDVLVGVPCGIIASTKQYSAWDYGFTSFALLSSAIPSFVIAPVFQVIFCVKLRWFPLAGLSTVSSYVLPIAVNALGGIALITRMTRNSMLETIRQDYIRTAKAKGMGRREVVRKHALKNALIPVITVTGSSFALMMGGALVVEMIFTIPGLGTYLYNGITNRDYPIINGSVILAATIVCIMSIVVDITYTVVDPRLKTQFVSKKSGSRRKKLAQAGDGHV